MRAGWGLGGCLPGFLELSFGSCRKAGQGPADLTSAGNPLVPQCRFQICYFPGLTSM